MLPSVLESSTTQPARPFSEGIAHLFLNYGAEHELFSVIFVKNLYGYLLLLNRYKKRSNSIGFH
ncbi:MAG: hypothetical protein LBK82_11540 [Planctomycetaceae bacterium]|nr:hypothetical protein [Planctomycetaceae bacterium]